VNEPQCGFGVQPIFIFFMTVLEVLNAATEYLTRQSVESPRLNAEHLLAHVLGKERRIDLYLEFERPVGEAERAPLRELVKRRAAGEPLQHLLGTVGFCGRLFLSDKRALIARPETEQLVEAVLARVTGETGRALDVGTGSGVIALTLALERPAWNVVAVDVSPEALMLTAENRARHSLDDRVELREGDLGGGVEGPFDVIAANLPYIPAAEIPGLAREVQWDPKLALDGGADGLDLIRRLIPQARDLLAPGGLLALEIGHDQAPAVAALLEENNYRDIERLPDYQNIERFLIARHG